MRADGMAWRPRPDRPAGAGGHPPIGTAERGFTLIELMVAVAIMALASAAVLFAMPDPRGSVRSEAERFAARVRAAQDAAVMGARPIALVVDRSGYRFETRAAGRWTRAAPDAAGGDAPAGDAWTGGTQARIGQGEGRAVFDPTGIGDPLEVVLVRDRARVAVHVGADGTVDVAD